jgi:hypothetical protein
MLDTCQPKNIEPYPKINSLQGVQKMDMMVWEASSPTNLN